MDQKKRFRRFSLAQRMEHLLLILSFTTLALTGLPQKFASLPISIAIIGLLGGIETIRIIHRTAAIIFLLEAVYHLVVAGYKLYVLRLQASLLPSLKDGADALNAFAYNLGLAKKQPEMGRYNFKEKAEYWAMLWGLVLMGLTGFMLWNPIAVTRFLPGQFIPAAKAAHGAEAILAVLAIIVWHFYNVHLRGWNWSMINGNLSRDQMEEEHALELQQIESESTRPTLRASALLQRQVIYFPIAAFVSLLLILAIYGFVSLETTSITTVPPAEPNINIFSPQTSTPLPTNPPGPPTEAPATPTAPLPTTQSSPAVSVTANTLTWDNGISNLFQQVCTDCHGTSGGVDLSSYQRAMDSNVIIPGDAAGSPLIKVQSQGHHPGQFTPEQLTRINAWIQAGAPEK